MAGRDWHRPGPAQEVLAPMQSQRKARRAYGSGSLIQDRGAWYGKWRIDGRQIKRRLGSADDLTRKQAERELRRQMERVAVPSSVEAITFQRAAEHLMDHLTAMGRKRKTLTEYRSYLRTHLNPALGSMRVERITRADIERFQTMKLRDGYKPKSVRNFMGLLHGVLEFCVRHEWIERNPAKLVEKPKVPKVHGGLRFLTLAELDALTSGVSLEDHLGPLDRVLYRTAAQTGLRQGELRGLRWRDVDWLASKVRVMQNVSLDEISTPKTDNGFRAVPLAHKVAVELQRHYEVTPWQGDDDLVFANPISGKPYDRSKILKRFTRALDETGVKRITFHELRHTFGTTCAASGVPMRTLQEWMGHDDIKTTLIYAHYAPSEREAEMIDRAFAASTSLGTNLATAGTN